MDFPLLYIHAAPLTSVGTFQTYINGKQRNKLITLSNPQGLQEKFCFKMHTFFSAWIGFVTFVIGGLLQAAEWKNSALHRNSLQLQCASQ